MTGEFKRKKIYHSISSKRPNGVINIDSAVDQKNNNNNFTVEVLVNTDTDYT